MTISNTLAKAGPFSGDGVNTSFPFGFKVFVASDVQVIKTSTLGVESTLVLNSDYSVALNADQNNSPGGTVTYPISGTKLALGESLTVVSNVPDLQQTDITNGGGFYPNIVEDMIDKRAIVSHQNSEAISRALKLPVSSSASTSTTLPVPVASNVIGWDPTGTKLQNYAGVASALVSTFMSSVVAATTAALARAGIGAAASGPLASSGITGAAASGANNDITSLAGLTTPITQAQGGTGTTVGATSKIQPISAAPSSNTMVVTINPTAIDSRSATLGSGTVTTIPFNSALTLTIPQGATLGSTNAAASRIAALLINNAGTWEPAVVNTAGGLVLDEIGLISTTAISASATANNVIYSASARTNVPYRVMGFFEWTQATAGTYLTNPSLIQGAGGRAVLPYRQLAQIQTSALGTLATGTGTFSINNTIPTNTNGDQYLSLTITPTNVNSLLEIDVTLFTCNSALTQLCAALFQDSTSSALAAGWGAQVGNAQQPVEVSFKHIMPAGTTSPTTFKVRAGGVAAGTTAVNGQSGSQVWGGVMASRIAIKEYLP